jgi:multidrug resistance efflux pump
MPPPSRPPSLPLFGRARTQAAREAPLLPPAKAPSPRPAPQPVPPAALPAAPPPAPPAGDAPSAVAAPRPAPDPARAEPKAAPPPTPPQAPRLLAPTPIGPARPAPLPARPASPAPGPTAPRPEAPRWGQPGAGPSQPGKPPAPPAAPREPAAWQRHLASLPRRLGRGVAAGRAWLHDRALPSARRAPEAFREAWRRHRPSGPDWAAKALRGVTYGGAILLAGSLLLASLPPILSDTSTRAVVNAPVVLVTAPIDGELDKLLAEPGDPVAHGEVMARIRNDRLDRSTLIGLENQTHGTRISLQGLRERIEVLSNWLESLDRTIEIQRDFALRVASEVEREARAKAASAAATLAEMSTLVARQRRLLEAGVVSREVLQIALLRERAAQEDLLAAQAALARREAERRSIELGSYAGETQGALGSLIERRRDASLELSRLRVDEVQLTNNLNALSGQTWSEAARLARLLDAEVPAPSNGHVLRAFASPGQRINAGDTIAGTVECRSAFVVGIFSVRQAHRLAVGARVVLEAEGWSEARFGHVRQVLPRTTDRVDTGYAVPFPPMERREMYVLIDIEPGSHPRTARDARGRPSVPCDIGRWVSVEIEGGFVSGLASAALRLSRQGLAMLFGQARGASGG